MHCGTSLTDNGSAAVCCICCAFKCLDNNLFTQPPLGTKQVRDREGGQEITGQGRRPKDSFIHKEGILSESQSTTASTSWAFAYSQ